MKSTQFPLVKKIKEHPDWLIRQKKLQKMMSAKPIWLKPQLKKYLFTIQVVKVFTKCQKAKLTITRSV